MAVNKKSGLPLCWTLLCGGQATGGRASQMGQESTVRDNAGRPKSRLPGTGGGAVGRGGWDQVREPCEGHRHLLVGGSLRRGGRATPRKSPAGPLSPRAGAVQDGRVGGGGQHPAPATTDWRTRFQESWESRESSNLGNLGNLGNLPNLGNLGGLPGPRVSMCKRRPAGARLRRKAAGAHQITGMRGFK